MDRPIAHRDPRVIAIHETIESADLSANEHWMLKRFVSGSLDQIAAAEYICDQISKHPRVETALLALKGDLISLGLKFNTPDDVPEDLDSAGRERENDRCFLTGATDDLQFTYIVPPSILDDVDLRPGGRLRRLLEVSLTTKLVEQLDEYLQSQKQTDKLKNVLLLTSSLRDAFRQGEFKISRPPTLIPRADFRLEETDPWFGRREPAVQTWESDMCRPALRWLNIPRYFTPATPDNQRLPLPKRSLLYIHTIVSYPLHFLAVDKEIQNGWPPAKQESRPPGAFTICALRLISRCIPASIRLGIYGYIHRSLPDLIPQDIAGSVSVKLLPLGLCLKKSRRNTTKNEATALQLVEKHAKDVPAPKLIDHVTLPDGTGFILMTTVPGDRLDRVLFRMTYEERRALGRDLGSCITQLRRIPNENNCSKHLITNTYGGSAYDHRFEDHEAGPFDSPAALAMYLTGQSTAAKARECYKAMAPMFDKTHTVYFTHSDLHHSNIYVCGDRLAGIVDWEYAGFKPEYWEYTKALWAYGAGREQKVIMDEAFREEDYSQELEAEMDLWTRRPVFC